MDYCQFELAMKVLDRYNIKPLIGVIPECSDPQLNIRDNNGTFWSDIRELQRRGYAIAMHGYRHVLDSDCRGLVNRGMKSEFAGHDINTQIERIKKGKKKLESEGIFTNVFFAPSHSYDENTVKALGLCGFEYMSDGKSVKPYRWHGVSCIPCISEGCPKISIRSHYTAVFHTNEWTRLDKKYAFDEFVALVERYHDSCVSWDEYVSSVYGFRILERGCEKVWLCWNRGLKPKVSRMIRHHK